MREVRKESGCKKLSGIKWLRVVCVRMCVCVRERETERVCLFKER